MDVPTRGMLSSVSPHRYIAQVDYQGDRHKHFPEDYNDRYTDALGVQIVRRWSLHSRIRRLRPEASRSVRDARRGSGTHVGGIRIFCTL
jgi:hypothetical protein